MLWLTPEFYSLDRVVETTQLSPLANGLDDSRFLFR